jgi:hypothetical protein
MAIGLNHLATNGSIANSSSYSSISISPTANALVVAFYGSADTGNGGDPSTVGISGGISLTQISLPTSGLTPIACGINMGFSVWRGLSASPGSGAMVFSHGVDGQSRALWSIMEFTGVKTSGVNGADAIANAEENTGTTGAYSVTMDTFLAAGNRPVSGVVVGSTETGRVHTQGTDFTEIGESTTGTEGCIIASQWRSDATDTLPDGSISGGTGDAWGAIALEIAAAVAGTLTRDQVDVPRGLARGLGRGMFRQSEKGLFLPDRRLLVPVGIQLQDVA